jgi:hypothetical protein
MRFLMVFASLLFSTNVLAVVCLDETSSDQLVQTTPTDRFTISGDGTEVTDNKTGLVWQRCQVGYEWNGTDCVASSSSEFYFTYAQALAEAQTISANDANNDWRVPNIKELASIVERACAGPAINYEVFPATTSYGFWSSTINQQASPNPSNQSSTVYILAVNFQSGLVGLQEAVQLNYLRLVKQQ